MRIALTALTPRGPQDPRGQRRRRCRDRPGHRGAARGGGGIRTARAGHRAAPDPAPRPGRGAPALRAGRAADRRPRPPRRAWRRPGNRRGPGPPPKQTPAVGPRGRRHLRRAAAQETLWLDGRPVDPRARAASVLRDGALVATDPRAAAATSLAEPAGLAEVRVVGGPAAGTVHRLGFGTLTLGASPDCQVRVTGTGLPAYAARLVIGPGGPAGQTIVEPLRGRPPTASRCCWTASR